MIRFFASLLLLAVVFVILFSVLTLLLGCDQLGTANPEDINPIATGGGLCRTTIEICGVSIKLRRGEMDVFNGNGGDPVYVLIEAVDPQTHSRELVVFAEVLESGEELIAVPVRTEHDTVVEIDVLFTELSDDFFPELEVTDEHVCATSETDWFCEVQ